MKRSGHVVVVTGAARGIGRAIALGLAARRAAVCVADVDGEAAAAAADEIRRRGADAMDVAADVTVESDVAALFEAVSRRFGSPTGLVNNAGVLARCPVSAMPLDEWQRVLAVHLTGTFLCAREAVRRMERSGGGSIVNVSSGLALKGMREGAHYAAAKAGVLGFTKSLAQEVGPLGIRVNAVAPGPVETELLRAGLDDTAYAAAVSEWRKSSPLGRLGRADDVVGPVLFLLSDEAGFLTGQTLHVNGGAFTP